MDKTEFISMVQNDKITLDDLRSVPYKMTKEDVADILVEMYYAFSVEMGLPENDFDGRHKTNRAILGCLLERWWFDLEGE